MLATMRLITAMLLLWPFTAYGQDALVFGSKVEGSLAAGETRAFVFQANGGDLVSGQAELNGPEAAVRFLDSGGRQVDGARVQYFYMAGNGARRVGFVAPSSGSYQLRFTSTGTQSGRFSLLLERRAPEERMRSINTLAKDVSSSPRIRQLIEDVGGGRADAVANFWRERADNGPLLESIPDNAQDMLVTFLWRETFATRNVLVGWPMAAFRNDDYFMSHLAGTDVWYKTIQLRRGTRVQYSLSPNVAQPSDRLFTDRLDPLNPRRFPTDGSQGDLSSVLELPGAPDDSWAVRIPVLRGAIEHTTFKSTLLGNQRDSWIYTPPGFDRTKGPYRLAVIFDGFAYVNAGWINAPQTFDNLINDGRIPPMVVCFLNSAVNRMVEFGYSGAGQLGDALQRELLPDLRERYGVGTTSGNVVIGGSSAGGLAAALIALEHPETFGSVLSQSGAFRLRKDGTDEPNTIAQMYAAAPRAPIRFYLEVGLYENVPSAALPLHESALDEGITVANRHFRDVLVAKGYAVTYRETAGAHENIHWSAMLADGLINLLGSK